MIILNYTPHDIKLFAEDEKTVLAVYPTVGILRVSTTRKYEQVEGFHLCPLFSISFGKVEEKDLPKVKKDTYYIVSSLVQQAHPERKDFIAPNTNSDSYGAVRDSKGYITGVKSFILNT